jgi:hypothetical protein
MNERAMNFSHATDTLIDLAGLAGTSPAVHHERTILKGRTHL